MKQYQQNTSNNASSTSMLEKHNQAMQDTLGALNLDQGKLHSKAPPFVEEVKARAI
jgi:hypothetical protein